MNLSQKFNQLVLKFKKFLFVKEVLKWHQLLQATSQKMEITSNCKECKDLLILGEKTWE